MEVYERKQYGAVKANFRCMVDKKGTEAVLIGRFEWSVLVVWGVPRIVVARGHLLVGTVRFEMTLVWYSLAVGFRMLLPPYCIV